MASEGGRLTLKPGSAAHEAAMVVLRAQGCTCQPDNIQVGARTFDARPWTGSDDPGLVKELQQGTMRPMVVDHQDDCWLSKMAGRLQHEEPLDRYASHEQAAALLLESTPALQCGATVLTAEESIGGKPIIDRQLAGYVEIDPKSEFGQEVIERWNMGTTEADNWSRWTLIDHGPKAKVTLEIVQAELDPSSDDIQPGYRGVICFEYPVDRDCIMTAATTGYLLVHAGDAALDEKRQHPEQRNLTYAHVRAQGKNSMLISLSTGDQALKMIEIMDARNPNLRKNTVHDVMRALDVAQETDPAWMEAWKEAGSTDPERLQALLKASPRPLAAATSVFTKLALHNAVLPDRSRTTKEVAEAVDMDPVRVEQELHAVLQSDDSWIWGKERENGEWEWQRDVRSATAELPMDFEGLDLMTADGRMQAARRLLSDMGVEIPIEEISPAMAFFKSMVDFDRFEAAFMELLRKPPPVWASARGFAKTMEQTVRRARAAKQFGMERTDQLTYLHLHLGHSLHIAHVLVMDSAQVNMLPKLSEAEQIAFAKDTPLAFDPLFIDFSGDERLPVIESSLSQPDEEVKLLGAVINSDPDPGVLFITPIFYYGNDTAPLMALALGTFAINRSGVRDYQFSYVLGAIERFTQPAMTIVAQSDAIKRRPDVAIEYQRIIELAAERILGALYLLEAANVEMVPRELSRRDRKRQEKRGWKIPMVVRVDRPSRRTYNHANGNGPPREYSHQFERIGHYNHVTRGSMVACIVCGGTGKKIEGLICPRCNDTGLDPEKVKPCVRIDVRTGEKTCPHGCRKIWISAHWVGPEDKPMVIKTRKIR